MRYYIVFISLILWACKNEGKSHPTLIETSSPTEIKYSKGFNIQEVGEGVRILEISSPWPNADTHFTYALVPKHLENPKLTVAADAIIKIPVERLVVTSTTHVPALEALGVADRLIGFPQTRYVSSKETRKRIDKGEVLELGSNEVLNTEMTIAAGPELVVGFAIDNQNKAYHAIGRCWDSCTL